MDGKEELKEAIELCQMMAEENPCQMKDGALRMLAKGVKALFARECAGGMNQRALGKYYGVDARTIQRWAKKFPDFPKGRHDGDKEVTYDTQEVVAWKKKHPELFGNT